MLHHNVRAVYAAPAAASTPLAEQSAHETASTMNKLNLLPAGHITVWKILISFVANCAKAMVKDAFAQMSLNKVAGLNATWTMIHQPGDNAEIAKRRHDWQISRTNCSAQCARLHKQFGLPTNAFCTTYLHRNVTASQTAQIPQ